MVVKCGEKLSLTRTTEAFIAEGQGKPFAARDGWDKLTQMLEIVLADLCASSHHQCTDDDDGVSGAVRILAANLEGTELLEYLVSETSI